jgi:hypothetical protein
MSTSVAIIIFVDDRSIVKKQKVDDRSFTP